MVRADGTQINTTATIVYPLSHIIGKPPNGCDDIVVELRISDLIERITSILPRKKLDKSNVRKFQLASGKSITPARVKEQEKAVQEFEEHDSGSEIDNTQNDMSYQLSP